MSTTTTTIFTSPPSSSHRIFKSTSSLQTRKHSASSVTIGQEEWVNVFDSNNEARYWTQKLGLGPQKYDTVTIAKAKYAHPRKLHIRPPVRSAVTQQVLFGPPLTSKHPPLAVVSGPRVNLYATASSSSSSAFLRAMNQQQRTISKSSSSAALKGEDIEPDRMVPTGGNLALCADFRNDGRLLAVGTDVGETRICDVTMRSTLATFGGGAGAGASSSHSNTTTLSLPVRSVQWFRNGQFILSAGDDAIAKIWNLSSTHNKQKPMLMLKGHGDVIRCTGLWQQTSKHHVVVNHKASTTVAAGAGTDVPPPMDSTATTEWTQVAVTGSYDHTVRIWNVQNAEAEKEEIIEQSRCLAVLTHGAPVEAVCILESEEKEVPFWLLSAGGTKIKVWNPRSGRCIHTVPSFHRKTITSLVSVLRSNYDEADDESNDRTATRKIFSRRILSAGLDGVIQIHSWDGKTGVMRHLFRTKLADAITSVATDATGRRLAFGTVSGDVLFRMKGSSIVDKKRKVDPPAGTYAFFQRGMNAELNMGDYTVTNPNKKRKKLKDWDIAMKKFRYAEALDEVLATKQPRHIVGVLEELGKRRALTHALSNRDEETLEPLLSFVIRNIRRPHFTSLLIGVAHKLMDIYGVMAGESDVVDELFRKLKQQVAAECKDQKALLFLVGQIEFFSATMVDH